MSNSIGPISELKGWLKKWHFWIEPIYKHSSFVLSLLIVPNIKTHLKFLCLGQSIFCFKKLFLFVLRCCANSCSLLNSEKMVKNYVCIRDPWNFVSAIELSRAACGPKFIPLSPLLMSKVIEGSHYPIINYF